VDDMEHIKHVLLCKDGTHGFYESSSGISSTRADRLSGRELTTDSSPATSALIPSFIAPPVFFPDAAAPFLPFFFLSPFFFGRSHSHNGIKDSI